MSELPNDLVPLPHFPWDKRPDSIPLDREEVRTAIWMADGNVTAAAKLVKINPSRLRHFIRSSEYLSREMEEAAERLIDKAEDVVRDALSDSDPSRADPMARFVLNSIGKRRGWGTAGSTVKIDSQGGNIVIGWADGSRISGDATIGAPMKDITPETTND